MDSCLRRYAYDMGRYVLENFKSKYNYLVPDSIHYALGESVACRTSPTNIGLQMVSVISLFDLGIISLDEVKDILQKTLDTVYRLEKWHGHLYNWYDIVSSEALLINKEVSTVDSGNFVSYLVVVKEFLREHDILPESVDYIESLIVNTEFNRLYSPVRNIYKVGFDISSGTLNKYDYDTYFSEMIQTYYVTCAIHGAETTSFSVLTRRDYKSWSGTLFEYLMPLLILKPPHSSLLDMACKNAVAENIKYGRKHKIPWGVSESALNTVNDTGEYDYKANGLSVLSFDTFGKDERTVAPYASFLSLAVNPKKAYDNLLRMERDAYGQYGFYDSITYSGPEGQANKAYMVHHIGMSIVAINNLLNRGIIRDRFYSDPRIAAHEYLLSEQKLG